MNNGPDLPPHLEQIGRQLSAAAHELRTSDGLLPTRRSRAWLTVGPVLAAAAAASVLIPTSTGSTPQRAPARALASVPRRHVGQRALAELAPLVHPTAVRVLRRAAFVALQTANAAPQPDQFVYTRTEDGTGQITQSWLSVDGTHASIIDRPGQATPTTIQGCVNGQRSSRTPGEDGKPLADLLPRSDRGRPVSLSQAAKSFGGTIPMDGPIVTTGCAPQPAFFPEMPTDPGSMLAYLVKIQLAYPTGLVRPSIQLNDLAKNVGNMLATDYLLPAQRAALYRFLATTPGVTLVQSVTDVSGRPGIGVQWSFEGSSTMLIFDPNTYQYLGTSNAGTGGPTAGTALLQTAIVDTAGQQPAPLTQTPGTSGSA